MKAKLFAILVLALFVAGTGCGKKGAEEKKDETKKEEKVEKKEKAEEAAAPAE